MKRIGQLLSNLYTSGKSSYPVLPNTGRLYVSRGVIKQKQLCRMIEHLGWYPSESKRTSAAFSGWGRKDSGLRALNIAKKNHKPFIALEDGFIRSVGLGQHGEPPFSIIMDSTGIYYDATTPSDLEIRLNNRDFCKDLDTERTRKCMDLLKQLKISKYNDLSLNAEDVGDHRDYVLVVDQTFNDPSIKYGLANSDTFTRMLEAAKKENPDKLIIVKTHPAVLAGKAKGHFSITDSSVVHLQEAINPWLLLDRASVVYTVTSGLGMEALIAGKRVKCFGMPFYAGWGLTEDQFTIDRRNPGITLENLFSAAYLEYPNYYDPYLDQLTTFEKTIETLAFLRDQNEFHNIKTYCIGMSAWKQPSVSAFLRSTYQEPVFLNSIDRAIKLSKTEKSRIVIWASKCTDQIQAKCEDENISLLKMEDGFLRSKGLGSDLIPPLSLVLDKQGIYYDPTKSSELEELIQSGDLPMDVLNAAKDIKNLVLKSGLTKYNVGESTKIENLPKDGEKKIILVPGQVADDASIKQGTSEDYITTNLDLLRETRKENPDAFIIYKPHPDVEAGNRYGYIAPHVLLNFADYIANDLSTSHALSVCDEVWTMTSLFGFEALLRNKKVVCYGRPFYSGWGLTTDKLTCSRRTRRATVDEIFAATHLIYSQYVFHGLDGFMRMPPHMAPAVLTSN